MSSIRVRFAPSPTGFLHIGGARTALFNWLYARHTGGKFILRIEDTDDARNSQEAVDLILRGLSWLGLDWDEGPAPTPEDPYASKGDFGPYFQSQRTGTYQKYVEKLLSQDMAYERDGAVRFRMTTDPVTLNDLVAGTVVREMPDREKADPDFVILRSDGKPVFHLVNVIDDLEMGITHVIRGEDHLSNTPKHLKLFEAFGVEAPKYAHIPLILNANGSKMSKRDDGASMLPYIEKAYAPEGVLNYLSLLGWSPKQDQEIFTPAEIVEKFDLPGVSRSAARFDLDKLNWANAEHVKSMAMDRFAELAIPELEKQGISVQDRPTDYVRKALDTCREKIKTFSEITEFAKSYFVSTVEIDADLKTQQFTADLKPTLEAVRQAIADQDPFEADELSAMIKELTKTLGVKMGKILLPTRLALTGSKSGPDLFPLMVVLGKEECLKRLDAAMNWINVD